MNKLYFGDNLHVLRKYVPDASVDLVYLDPPFNSNADYNLLFKASSGRGHRAQIQAFEDSWHWGEEAEEALSEVRARGGAASAIIRALREALGPSDMMAYLVMMAVRLTELHRVLRSTGSLILHCDPTASHYLKVILDGIFGAGRLRNEIIWKRSGSKSDASQGARHFPRSHDTLLLFSKTDASWYEPIFVAHDPAYVKAKYPHEDATGRRYGLWDMTGPGGAAKGNPFYEVMGVERYWRYSRDRMNSMLAEGKVVQPRPGAVPREKRYHEDSSGVALNDVWADLAPVNSQARERLGYPTQKPLALLERLIASCSRKGDLVLDPFCGCGTTVHAAQKLGRSWIGIDITHVAIQVIVDRLGQWIPGARYEIIGQPRDLAGAQELARLDKYQFQWWATWLCGGQPAGGGKKGADGGVDGTLEFATGRGQQDWGVVSVKGGKNVGVDMVRQLEWAVRNESAAIGVLITLVEPTRDMEKAAVTAGFVDLGGEKYRRIQIRTVEQLLDGNAIESPYLLTTVQEVPAKSTRGAGSRVPLSPADTLAQRNILLPIPGGRTSAPKQATLPLDEPLLTSTPAVPRRVRRRRA